MATPGKARQSAIPTPGKSGIPTPGRSRSVSGALQSAQSDDHYYMSRALADAIKANDPAQHRHSLADAQSTSSHPLQSGRRSVSERNHATRPPERAKTPATTKSISRPPSRHSDVFTKSSTKPFETKPFEVGDSVIIESLSMEGTLRYIGEIEGKNGLWAGVELSAQFAGRGKNNGSVNGIQYFSCSESCGVFVATTKLSPGRNYLPRPSSAASSRSGRVTPSLSTSRMSLPFPNGRITPSSSSGRLTPGTTPSTKSNPPSKLAMGQKSLSKPLPEKLTPGSRAAKYANMTAKQLSSRRDKTSSPTRQIGGRSSSISSSPSPISRTLSSPSRPSGSPFSTPKPGLNGRASNILTSTRGPSIQNTPRGRIPSSVAMPPPGSPIFTASRSASLSKPGLEELAVSNIEAQSKMLQDRITLLTTNGAEESPHQSGPEHPFPVNLVDDHRIRELQARIEALEVENDKLLSQKDEVNADRQLNLVHSLEEDRDRIAELNAKLTRDRDETLKAQEATLASLQNLRSLHDTSQKRIDELETQCTLQLAESQRTASALNAELSSVQLARQKLEQENQLLQNEKADLIAQVEDLGAQVDELRVAGQETIALYEERLSNADSQRYDLESRISSLEKGTSNRDVEDIPHTPNHKTATEIDNEALRDQVLYLQKKITTLEDLIEDSRIASEREENALRERVKKLKEKEDGMKLELTEGLQEVERVTKAEVSARSRVEEIEEALRESRVALENARAEIEGLRAELANVDSLQNTMVQLDQPEDVDLKAENASLLRQNEILAARIAELGQTNEVDGIVMHHIKSHINGEGSKHTVTSPTRADSSTREEITGLKHIVQDLQQEHSAAAQKIKLLESENEILKSETQVLQSEAEHLRKEIQILEINLDTDTNGAGDHNSEVNGSNQPGDVDSVRRLLKEQKVRYEADAEQLRKRLTEAEMSHARTKHDLNKEISELEALVESKIYREVDELEQEVERLKEKVTKTKSSSKGSGGNGGSHRQPSSTFVEGPDADKENEEVPNSLINSRSPGQFCSDCEKWGHSSATCPHSQDVF
ncbi:hypothetical protein AGABI1DRAFT_126945 [Agaricus bisporus var. burnettii JB137-S8]|uniref:CAP-Gly domain-containing protein n=1 Tax=Agaricus bisporus var. burnettii (strain JB137-S8 / ATCC MYA-4627 / FGSC 10392) TaxID=597362 RepID=K5XC59_AGABU|nr:uncharacterized protein AGABI1DRAFT_126945 [Agaricus bisporus var. burnettii JB137-S8]EKM80888.1 hypothetical protein AGABI1DRAFT_126945 [Agaricus bisporus var. burnettii JB137-S8]